MIYAAAINQSRIPYEEDQIDVESNNRKVWMFPLELTDSAPPELTVEQARKIEENQAALAKRLSLEQLKRRDAKAKKQPAKRSATSTAYVRDAAVFVSMGTPYTDEYRHFRDLLERMLRDQCGVDPRIIGRNEYEHA